MAFLYNRELFSSRIILNVGLNDDSKFKNVED